MSDWSAATFDGSARATADAVATSTVEQRLAWLEDLLRLALESGALLRVREARQADADELWARGG
jgi:hypothetical protein